MRTIETSIDIAAAVAGVAALTDVDRYLAWDSFITGVDGVLREGGKLRPTPATPGARTGNDLVE
jgi:hypothetical protein